MSRDISGAIGEKIAEIRARKGWTQQQLADAIQNRRPQVNAWEKGRQRPTKGNLVLLARALEVHPKELGLPYRPDDPRPHQGRHAVMDDAEPDASEIRGADSGTYERKVGAQMAEYLRDQLMTKLVAIVGAFAPDDQEDVYNYVLRREVAQQARRIKNKPA